MLRRYVEPLLEVGQLESIRIAPSRWPTAAALHHRTPTRRHPAAVRAVQAAGKNLAFMATSPIRASSTHPGVAGRLAHHLLGATIRTQAPLIRSINDDPEVWSVDVAAPARMG
ncbi:hypothetical protein GCM10020219_096750 [Nonomuraea dietziae]